MYRHTQIGYLLIFALTLSLLTILFAMIVDGFLPILLTIFFALLVCLTLFPSLTIEIDETKLIAKFGCGIINKKFILKDIESCHTVKNPWYYGWGIHWTPYGWLYNVSGFLAVEIKMKNNKKCRIGTDEPEKLERAITQAIK